MQGWNWTPRARAIGGAISAAFCVGVYWLAFWVLF